MKLPMPDEAKAALEQTTADMAAMRAELGEIKELLKVLITTQYLLAGLDGPPNL